MNSMARRCLTCLALSLGLAACGSLNSHRSPAAGIYDLGLPDAVSLQGTPVPASIEVRAPSWLAGNAMQYRLEYAQPSQRQAYAESRWASPPAELLEVGLRRMLPPDGRSACRLRIDLDEFTQVYATHDSSQALVAARAELLAPRSDTVLARRDLRIAEAAPTPDASGGVIAHRAASRRLAEELTRWLAGISSAPDGGGAIQRACAR
ncbi:MAG TPA: ABC-type transport auxiliary lipoprotein family protein [Aromatoleum sp.]|uniref:ABC-type transport auxiliary lipoprotein family protein n=1 Tax=Aromatoleum sp. TaxID=2307007 RepID=UPI002B4A4E58|nr:ABC-type transport auxiliary lipoprotein family protein [Aromatoleum sp.]HJV26590.1 ABC-type transport auxiliary lipoprotein family protein [Aromatoleum sp.]